MGDSNSQMSHSVKDQTQNSDDDDRARPPFFVRLSSPLRKENKLAKISAEKGTEEPRTSPGTSTSSELLKNDSKEAKNTGHTDTSFASSKNYVSETENINNEKSTKSSSGNYLMWENNFNLCWLDASMALLAHNQTLNLRIDSSSSSQISTILKYYNEAILEVNDFTYRKEADLRLKSGSEKLKVAQDSALSYLQPRMKYKEGEPDSAFCSLYNLMVENKSIRSFFDVEFVWVKECQKCKMHRSIKYKKPIITLAKVKSFCPDIPVSIFQCPSCKEPDQKMTLFYKKLPACLTFHFENGAGCGELQCLDFEVNARKYEMTGVIILEKIEQMQVNHFVTWIRDPAENTWLECNDLINGVKKFTSDTPVIKLEEVYIITFEAVDKLGIVTETSDGMSYSPVKRNEGSDTCNDEIPFIDLSDETDEKSENKNTNLENISSNKSNKCNMDEQNLVKKDSKKATTTTSKSSQDSAVSDPDLLEICHTEPKTESVELASESTPFSLSKSNDLKTDNTLIKDKCLKFPNNQEVQVINKSNSIRSDKIPTKDNSMKFCNDQEVRMISNLKKGIGKDHLQGKEDSDCDSLISDTLRNKETGTVNETVVTRTVFGRNIDSANTEVTLKNLRSGVIKRKVTSKKDCDTKSPLKMEDIEMVKLSSDKKSPSRMKDDKIMKLSSDTKSPLRMKGNEVDKLSYDNAHLKDESKNSSVNTLAYNQIQVKKDVKETVAECIVSEEKVKQPKEIKIAAKNLRNITEKRKNDITENQLSESAKKVKSHEISRNEILGKRKMAEEIETESEDVYQLIDECSSVEIQSKEKETEQNNQFNNDEIVSLKETLKTPEKSSICKNSKQMSPVETHSAKKGIKRCELSHCDFGKIENQTTDISPRRKVTPKKQCCEITKSPQNPAKETDLSNKRKQNVNVNLSVAVPRYSTRKSVQTPVQSSCKETHFEESIVNSKPEQIAVKTKSHDDVITYFEKTYKKIKTDAEDPTKRKKTLRPSTPFNTTTRSMKVSTKPNSVLDSIKQLDNCDTSTVKTCDPIAGATQKESKTIKSVKSNFGKNGDIKNEKGKASYAKRKKIRDMLPKEKPNNSAQLATTTTGNSIFTFIKKIQERELRKKGDENNTLSNFKGAESVLESKINSSLKSDVENSFGNQHNPNGENLNSTNTRSLALTSNFCGGEDCHCTKEDRDNTIDLVADYMATQMLQYFCFT